MSAKKEGFFKSEFFHNFVRSPGAMAGLLIVTFFVVLVTAGPLFTPQNPYDIGSLDLMDAFKPPVWMEGGDGAFLLGTDDQGDRKSVV